MFDAPGFSKDRLRPLSYQKRGFSLISFHPRHCLFDLLLLLAILPRNHCLRIRSWSEDYCCIYPLGSSVKEIQRYRSKDVILETINHEMGKDVEAIR